MTGKQSDTVLFAPTPRKLWPRLGILLLTAGGGFALAVLGTGFDRLLGLFLFLSCGGFGLAAARRTNKVITIAAAGIQHPELGLIPWGDITSVRVASSMVGRLLTIDVADRAAYERRQRSAGMRWLMRIDRATRRPLLSLPEAFLTASAASFRDELDARRSEAARA